MPAKRMASYFTLASSLPHMHTLTYGMWARAVMAIWVSREKAGADDIGTFTALGRTIVYPFKF